jgi:hypothetical protein
VVTFEEIDAKIEKVIIVVLLIKGHIAYYLLEKI